MFAGEAGGKRLRDERGAGGGMAVDRERDADAVAANGDALVGRAGGDRFGELVAIVRIIDRRGAFRPKVQHLMAEPAQMLGERRLHLDGGVIGSDGNAIGHARDSSHGSVHSL